MQTQTACVIRTIVVFILSAEAYVWAQEDANSLYQRARSLERQGKYADAVVLYNKICTEFPEDSFASPDKAGFREKYAACGAALEKGNIASAKKIVEQIKILAVSPELKPAQLYNTGRLFEEKELFADAMGLYQQVMREYPNVPLLKKDSTIFHIKCASCGAALERGDVAVARELAEQIKALACSVEQKASRLYLMGHLFEEKQFFTDAAKFYQQLITECPETPRLQTTSAAFHIKYTFCGASLENNNAAKARELAEKIILACSVEQKSNRLYEIGRLFEDRQLFADAMKFYQRLEAEYPDSQQLKADNAIFHIKYVSCGAALENGDVGKARELAEQIKALPCSAEHKASRLCLMGYLFEEKQLFTDAAKFYQQLTIEHSDMSRLQTESMAFHIKYVFCGEALENEDAVKARELANQIVLACPAEQKAGRLYILGRLFEEKALFTDAERFYRQLMAEYPNTPQLKKDNADFHIKYTFCGAALESGDAIKARELADQIKTIAGPTEQKTSRLYMLGRLFEEKEQFTDAVHFYRQLITEYPDALQLKRDNADFHIKYVLYGAALKKGDVVKARELADEIKIIDSPPEQKAPQLYWVGRLFEKNKLFTDAIAFYQQLITEYPAAPHSGPDKATFRLKYTSCCAALEDGNMVSAVEFAEQIKALDSSLKLKSGQLYETGRLFKKKSLLTSDREPNKINELLDISESFYKEVLKSADPNNEYFRSAEISRDTVAVLRLINSGDVALAKAGTDKMKAEYSGNIRLIKALAAIGERCYGKGLVGGGEKFFRLSTELFKDTADANEGKDFTANVYYALGLNCWQLGEYSEAAEDFIVAIEADPNHEFAGNMHWLIADCYEKLKATGDVNTPQADAVIEWGYQTLFDNYPNCNIIDYAAMRLSQINMEKGRETAACGYYCWLVMNADGDKGKMDFINHMFKRCGRCGK